MIVLSRRQRGRVHRRPAVRGPGARADGVPDQGRGGGGEARPRGATLQGGEGGGCIKHLGHSI